MELRNFACTLLLSTVTSSHHNLVPIGCLWCPRREIFFTFICINFTFICFHFKIYHTFFSFCFQRVKYNLTQVVLIRKQSERKDIQQTKSFVLHALKWVYCFLSKISATNAGHYVRRSYRVSDLCGHDTEFDQWKVMGSHPIYQIFSWRILLECYL